MSRAAALLALLPQQQARDFIINSMFHEVPDRGAALAAMALWAAVSCRLVVLTVRTRTWFMLLAGEEQQNIHAVIEQMMLKQRTL
jgi:hypothetical protein